MMQADAEEQNIIVACGIWNPETKLPKSPLAQRSCLPETTDVTNTVQAKQNRFDFFIFLSGNSRFP